MLYYILRTILIPVLWIYGFFPKVIGKENLKYLGKEDAIIAANHIYNIDPVVLGVVLRKRKINYMAKKQLFKYAVGRWFFNSLGTFPVDRKTANVSAIKAAMKVLNEKKVLGIFPSGKRGELIDPLKEGVALIAHKSQSTVLPVVFVQKYGFFKFKRIIISVGKPMEYEQFYDKKLDPEVMKAMTDMLSDRFKELVHSWKK